MIHKLTIAMIAALLLTEGPAAAQAEREAARQHFQKGQTEYDLGHFDTAIREFEEAYRLFPNAAFLFNLGQAYRKLGNNERALFFYRGYLRNTPSAANRAEVESWISELEKPTMIQPPAAPPPPPPQPEVEATAPAPAPTADDGSGLRTIGYWTLGASGAVLAAGVVFGLLAKSKSDEVEDAGAAGDVPIEEIDGLRSNGENYEKAQIISLIVGGAGAVTGGVLVWMGWPSGPAEVAVGPGTIMLQGRF